ncbi:immunoglobulin lambda-1 light chain-like [Zootoca vivipara]|uniref:immunoglobulin lambda-1 light chain-like n=1 Tax=Zootoca vivipara TaxID=8524 RepID=UPI00293BD53E|nr:immunoglobulin lambda-1 light chain-like [Zootoca vivipara]
MGQFLFLLALFTYCSGVTSQSAWTQPASESAAPGQTAKLSCTTSDTGDAVRWFQQRSGQAPRFVQYEGGSRGEGIPDRFTASRSGNIGYLTITNVQAEDEAVYYCGRWNTAGNVFHGGVICQSICTQPASESVAPGQTIKLSCTTSDTGSAVRWFQQRSGQAPRFVQYEGSSRGEGIPDRFTASRSGNIGYLTITNVQAEDEAVYYCCRWYDSAKVFHNDTNQWGSVTKTFPPPPKSSEM